MAFDGRVAEVGRNFNVLDPGDSFGRPTEVDTEREFTQVGQALRLSFEPRIFARTGEERSVLDGGRER